MKLTIVYDNDIYKKNIDLKSDWGFSCLIETEGKTILFDTGANGEILLNNMRLLGIDPYIIDIIVISHEHWDHNGGLKALGLIVDDIELYRLEDKPCGNMNLKNIGMSQKITKGVYTTGKLTGTPKDEQSLILQGKDGWYVLAGCSHSSVEKILNVARTYGDVVGLIGGLHGFNNFHVLNDLKLVCPVHCSKYKKKIHELFPDASINAGVGKIIEI